MTASEISKDYLLLRRGRAAERRRELLRVSGAENFYRRD
jgi:hypothetical protein